MDFQYTIKSDVFSLGLCILNAGSLSTIEKCYDPMYYRFDETMLQGKINFFEDRYKEHRGLVDFVKRCLIINIYDRPSANELKSYLSQHPAQEIEDPYLSRYSSGHNFAMIHCQHPEPCKEKQFLRNSTLLSQGSLY